MLNPETTGCQEVAGEVHTTLQDFLASLSFDKRLYTQDIQGSLAHVQMLKTQGMISEEEATALTQALEEVLSEIEAGTFQFDVGLEDIHMNIEQALITKLGPDGGKVHTARSRNDQVALDLKLFVRDEVKAIMQEVVSLQKAISTLAEENLEIIIPGYTHLQQAQPILFSHLMMAHYEQLKRDHSRFQDCLNRMDECPLGCAALAGTSHPIDRDLTAKLLGFSKPNANSLDGVSDRDYTVEAVFCASLTMTHLSGLCEELIIYSSKEFNFIKISDTLTTGSSIMPQKRNPDIPELVRGKTGRVNGNLINLLTVLKGLPLAYNKDLQEDKEALFDTLDTVKMSLMAMTELINGITVIADQEKIIQQLEQGFTNATELADHLAQKGMPFRSAYNITKTLVAYCQENGKVLSDLTEEELEKHGCPPEGVLEALDIKGCIARKNSFGGTATEQVKGAIGKAKSELGC